MTKKILLKDIALRAGVSTTLVSYVINNKKENRINKETAQKIREIAGALNYRPNQVAKSLKTKKTFTIGVIVADISNPFSANLARILEDEAEKYNYTVIFGSSDENNQKFEKLTDTFINRQVDGLIISPPSHAESQIKNLQQMNIPFVLLDRYFTDIDTSYVALDNYNASREVVNHLLSTGRKRIGMITYKSDLFHLQERERGYLTTLKKNKIRFEKNWLKEININNDRAEIEKAVHEMLFSGSAPDAIFLGSNKIANISLRYIKSLPLKVPDDLAIVSFDQAEILDFFNPPLTYIRQPLQEMGEQAIHFLLEEINNAEQINASNLHRQINLKAELIIRGSTAPSVL